MLVIDGLDALLAASGDGVSVGDVEDMVMELREVCLFPLILPLENLGMSEIKKVQANIKSSKSTRRSWHYQQMHL